VMYTYNTSAGPPIAQSVQFNLKQIGVDVEIKLFDRVVQHEKTATRGEPFDLTLEGWLADYPDPANFVNVLLDGRRIQADNNVNASYFNNAAFNKRMDQAQARRRRPRERVRDPRPRHHEERRPGGAVHLDGLPLADEHQGRLLRLHGRRRRAPDPDLHQVGAEQEKDRKTRAGEAIASPARFHSTPDSTTLPTKCCDT